MADNELFIFIIIQIVGFVGYGIYVASSFQKNRFMLLLIEALGCGVVALHWKMMNMDIIAMMNIVYVYLSIVSLMIVRFPQVRYMLVLSFPMIIILSLSSWQGSMSGLLAITATCLGVMATMLAVCSKFCIDMYKLRVLSLISSMLWVACGIFAASIPQIIACGAFAYGHILGLKRLARDDEPQGKGMSSMSDYITQAMGRRRMPIRVTVRESRYDRESPHQ